MPKTLPSPDGEGFFYKPLETAAKRRKGAGTEVPCWGLGQSPKQGMGWQPHRNPKSRSDSIKNQESGSEAKPDSAQPCFYRREAEMGV